MLIMKCRTSDSMQGFFYVLFWVFFAVGGAAGWLNFAGSISLHQFQLDSVQTLALSNEPSSELSVHSGASALFRSGQFIVYILPQFLRDLLVISALLTLCVPGCHRAVNSRLQRRLRDHR